MPGTTRIPDNTTRPMIDTARSFTTSKLLTFSRFEHRWTGCNKKGPLTRALFVRFVSNYTQG
jgi:hypothetical protein